MPATVVSDLDRSREARLGGDHGLAVGTSPDAHGDLSATYPSQTDAPDDACRGRLSGGACQECAFGIPLNIWAVSLTVLPQPPGPVG